MNRIVIDIFYDGIFHCFVLFSWYQTHVLKMFLTSWLVKGILALQVTAANYSNNHITNWKQYLSIVAQKYINEYNYLFCHFIVRGRFQMLCVSNCCDCSLLFSRLVMSNSLPAHELQHTRLPLSFTISQSLLKLMSIESMMPSNHFILCHHLLLLPSIFPSITLLQ